MKQGLLFFIIFLAFTACTSEDKKIPKDILPLDKMKLIVWDMTQAGAYVSFLQEKDTTKKKLNTAYLAAVLKLHNISKSDFLKSFKFYQAHPLLNQQLFDSVSVYGQRQRNEMYKKRQ